MAEDEYDFPDDHYRLAEQQRQEESRMEDEGELEMNW